MSTPVPQAVSEPTMYCRKCGYVLDGLSECRCPECGSAFDPANGRTFNRLSRDQKRRRLRLTVGWAVFLIALAAATLLIVGAVRHVRHQRLATVLTGLGARFDTRPIGPAWLRDIVDEKYLQRFNTVNLTGHSITDESLAQLRGLSAKSIIIVRTSVTDRGLAELRQIRDVRYLHLDSANIKGPGSLLSG